MNNMYLLILTSALVTMIIRFSPFIVFKKNVPEIIKQLSSKLPYAIMTMLVVYCIKDTNLTNLIPTVLSIGFVVLIHLKKKNTLLSIALGTLVYMILIHIF